MNEESIFAVALQIDTAAERAAYLDEACQGDARLRQGVEALLEASAGAEKKEFLSGHPGAAPTIVTTRADGDTHDSSDSSLSLPFLDPCESPNRIGKLGHYEVIELVGRGGMGSVLRAFDTKLARIVAVKVMAPELAANPTAVKRFLREAQTAAAVHHDHVVTIHAIEETHRPPYLVMQFVEGQTLQQKIDREGALDLVRILRIGSQMAAGLAAAHKHGLIHRDVKPGNILLENGVERVKITDFGLARAADDVEMTQTGMIAGTPQYMSPEQATGETIDVRSDLFSLGSVLYTMCTGRPAFRAETTMGVLKRVCEDTPRPISEVNSSLPPWLSAIVAKLMAKNPADRFQTASEAAEMLSQHLAHLQNPATSPRPETVFAPLPRAYVPAVGKPPQMMAPPASSLPRRSSFPWLALGIVAAIGLCMVLPIGLLAIGFLTPVLHRKSGGAVIQRFSEVNPPLVDLNHWGKWVDPDGNCEILREAKRVGFVLPGGFAYNLLPTVEKGVNAPRLVREIEGDFTFQCRVAPFEHAAREMARADLNAATWRSAGAVVAIDDRSLLRFERVSWAERNGGEPRLHAEWFVDGKKVGDRYETPTIRAEQPTWLRIEKRDAQVTLHYSADGVNYTHWITIVDMAFPRRVQVGLAAVHTTLAAFEPWFDEVRVQMSPQASTEGNSGSPTPTYRVPGWGATWRADSKAIVRHDSNQVERFPTGSLERFEIDTGVSTPLVTRGKDPFFSPIAGGPIAFAMENRDGTSNIYVCEAGGANPRVVSDGYYVSGWLPDGSRLVEYSWRENRLRTVAWNDPTAKPETLFQFEEPIGSYPAISFDGQRVAYQVKRSDHLQIVVREISSREIVVTYDVEAEFLLAGWSPDGARVAFGSLSKEARDFWILDVASGEARRVLQGHFTFPRWSPDGKWIAVDNRDLAEVWIYPAAALDPWLNEPHASAAEGEFHKAAPPAKAPFSPADAALHQQAWARGLGQDVEIENSIGMKLRLIPAGEFDMGSTKEELESLIQRLPASKDSEAAKSLVGESPRRRVRVRRPFYLAATEVTVGQFKKFVEATGYATDGERSGDGGWSGRDGQWIRHADHLWKSPGAWTSDTNEPVVHVSFNDAIAFCQWLGETEGRQYALPTETQWEFAARAGSTRLFGASDDVESLDRLAYHRSNRPATRDDRPQPVAGLMPNAFGLYDMLGNVWEWTDSQHPQLADKRVLRGGSWYIEPLVVRPAARGAGAPNMAWDAGTGFRVAIVDLKQASPAESPGG